MTDQRQSALEKMLRNEAEEAEASITDVSSPWADDMALEWAKSSRKAADLVHERDAALWALVEECNVQANKYEGSEVWMQVGAKAMRDCAAALLAILEGETP